MVDEGADEGGIKGTVEHEGIPVAFVHVVAGEDGRVLISEGKGAVGVALEVEARWHVLGDGEGEHFAGDFIDEHIGAEGGGFFGTLEGEAVGDGVGQIHGWSGWCAGGGFIPATARADKTPVAREAG